MFGRFKNKGGLWLALCLSIAILGMPVAGQAQNVVENANESSLKSRPDFHGDGAIDRPLPIFKVAGGKDSTDITISLEKRMPAQQPPVSPEKKKGGKDGRERTGITPQIMLVPPGDELRDPFAERDEDLPELKDPLEGYNRWMYKVNDRIFEYFMEPVTRGYVKVVPEYARLRISNVYSNALAPVKFVGSLLQGDLDKTSRVLARLIINSTLGLGGMYDVAGNYYKIEDVDEDFAQVLGAHGFPTGPYLVLPFFGPSHLRGVAGRITDSFLSPLSYYSPTFLIGAGITLEDTINSISFKLDDIKDFKESAIDPYESMRDFYHQHRQKLLKE